MKVEFRRATSSPSGDHFSTSNNFWDVSGFHSRGKASNAMISKICILLGMNFLVFLLLDSGAMGQGFSMPSLGDLKFHGSYVVIPGGTPTLETDTVYFERVYNWGERNRDKTIRAEQFKSVKSVAVREGMDRSLMEFVASLPSVTHLHIEAPGDIDFSAAIAPLSGMKKLKTMELRMVNVRPRGCSFLSELQSLVEFRCDMILKEEDLITLSGLPHLRRLGIGSIHVDRELNLKDFQAGLPKLTHLSVGHISALEFFRDSPNIVELRIRTSLSASEVELLSKFRKFRKLETLSISMKSIANLKSLNNFPALRELSVRLQK